MCCQTLNTIYKIFICVPLLSVTQKSKPYNKTQEVLHIVLWLELKTFEKAFLYYFLRKSIRRNDNGINLSCIQKIYIELFLGCMIHIQKHGGLKLFCFIEKNCAILFRHNTLKINLYCHDFHYNNK